MSLEHLRTEDSPAINSYYFLREGAKDLSVSSGLSL